MTDLQQRLADEYARCPARMACPACGEDRQDALEWTVDECLICCCGTTYDPAGEALTEAAGLEPFVPSPVTVFDDYDAVPF